MAEGSDDAKVLRIEWSGESLRELTSIRSYITQFAPLAAQRLALRLVSAAERLARQPERGRLIGAGVRELVVIRPYLVRYQVAPGAVRIIRIRHGARRP